MKHLRKYNEAATDENLPYKFKLDVGDVSGDGHGKHDTYIIESNLPHDVVRSLYKEAVEETGIDVTKYCDEYEDSSIPVEIINELESHGVDIDAIGKYTAEELREGNVDGPEALISLIMAMVKMQEESFQWKYGNDSIPDLGIGSFGYGLFYS